MNDTKALKFAKAAVALSLGCIGCVTSASFDDRRDLLIRRPITEKNLRDMEPIGDEPRSSCSTWNNSHEWVHVPKNEDNPLLKLSREDLRVATTAVAKPSTIEEIEEMCHKGEGRGRVEEAFCESINNVQAYRPYNTRAFRRYKTSGKSDDTPRVDPICSMSEGGELKCDHGLTFPKWALRDWLGLGSELSQLLDQKKLIGSAVAELGRVLQGRTLSVTEGSTNPSRASIGCWVDVVHLNDAALRVQYGNNLRLAELEERRLKLHQAYASHRLRSLVKRCLYEVGSSNRSGVEVCKEMRLLVSNERDVQLLDDVREALRRSDEFVASFDSRRKACLDHNRCDEALASCSAPCEGARSLAGQHGISWDGSCYYNCKENYERCAAICR